MRQRIRRWLLRLPLLTALRTALAIAIAREQERTLARAPVQPRPTEHERSQAEEELRYLAVHVPCLLWYGLVTQRDDRSGWLDWQTRMLDDAAAQNFIPPYAGRWRASFRHTLVKSVIFARMARSLGSI